MQRIPSVDIFGTPRRLGIVGSLGQTVQVPRGSVEPTTAFRFEIMDAEGNPIPGAAVSLYLNNTHLMTPALADVGGNVAVPLADLQNAAEAIKQRGISIRTGMLNAVVQAPGYQETKVNLLDVATERKLQDIEQRRTVTLQKEGEGIPVLPILGVLAAIGAIVWFSTKS